MKQMKIIDPNGNELGVFDILQMNWDKHTKKVNFVKVDIYNDGISLLFMFDHKGDGSFEDIHKKLKGKIL